MIPLQLILPVLQIHGKFLNFFVTSITHLEVTKTVELSVSGTLTLSPFPGAGLAMSTSHHILHPKHSYQTIYAVVSQFGLNPQGHRLQLIHNQQCLQGEDNNNLEDINLMEHQNLKQQENSVCLHASGIHKITEPIILQLHLKASDISHQLLVH